MKFDLISLFVFNKFDALNYSSWLAFAWMFQGEYLGQYFLNLTSDKVTPDIICDRHFDYQFATDEIEQIQ